MRRQMDDMFGRAPGDERAGPPAAAWSPATEITSSDDGWTLRVALPGIDPKDVHIELSGTSLTISGHPAPGRRRRRSRRRSPNRWGRPATLFAVRSPRGRHVAGTGHRPVGAPRVAPRPIGYEPARDRGTRGDVAPDAAEHGHAPDLVAGAWNGDDHMAGPGLRSEPTGLARASLATVTAWGMDPAMALPVTRPAAKMTRIRVPVAD